MRIRIATLVLALALSFGLAQPQGTLTIAQGQDPQSWDPIDTFFLAWGMVGSSIFDGLVHRGLDMQIGPGLATSWEWIGEDDDRLRFYLRQGVTFHNGEPFDAEAVKATLDRVRVAGATHVSTGFTTIAEVRIEDPHTVHIVTVKPDPLLPGRLAQWGAQMLPPGYFEEVGAEGLALKAVGTGPYRFVQ